MTPFRIKQIVISAVQRVTGNLGGGGGVVHGDSLLLESGDYLLLESGDTILLE